MAITIYTIEDGPSLYELMMTLFPEDDPELSLAQLEAARLRSFEIGNSPSEPNVTVEAHIHTVRRGHWDTNRKARCFYLQGEIREDEGRHGAERWAAWYFPRLRYGSMLRGAASDLEVRDEEVYADGVSLGSVKHREPLTGFFHSFLAS